MLKPPSALSGYFGNDSPPLATDGRFSGGSRGVLVAHLPDAYKKNNLIPYLKDGDIIEMDLNKNSIELISDISTDNKQKKIELSGYLNKYRKLVGDISTGYLT